MAGAAATPSHPTQQLRTLPTHPPGEPPWLLVGECTSLGTLANYDLQPADLQFACLVQRPSTPCPLILVTPPLSPSLDSPLPLGLSPAAQRSSLPPLSEAQALKLKQLTVASMAAGNKVGSRGAGTGNDGGK